MKIKSIIELKKSVINTHILCIIICNFSYRQELCLVVLLTINKYLEIDHNYAILLLS